MKQFLVGVLFGFVLAGLPHARAGSFKPSHQYKCFSTNSSYSFLLTVNLNNFDSKIQLENNLADLDQNFKGAPNAFRFVYEQFDEGTSEALLEAPLVSGGPNGKLVIKTHGEDDTLTKFNCSFVR